MRRHVDQRILLDGRFTGLTPDSQHLYLMACLNPKTNPLGVCEWDARTIGAYTNGLDAKTLDRAGRELADAGLIDIDTETGEALITGHIDRDVDAGDIEAAYIATESPRLRRAIVRELRDGATFFDFPSEDIACILRQPYEEPTGEDTRPADAPKPGRTKANGGKKTKTGKTADAESKPKRGRGRPRKIKAEPVMLEDGTMEPPFGEPITTRQLEMMPRYDAGDPIDMDENGRPKLIDLDSTPEQLWFWHPVPDDWTPTVTARELYESLHPKLTLQESEKAFLKEYATRYYTERSNGHRAAPLDPDRLFIQQILLWRKLKDEENAAKAEKETQTPTENAEPVAEPVDTPAEPDVIDLETEDTEPSNIPLIPEDEVPEDKKPEPRHYRRMVPKDWKPNEKHRARAAELGVDIDLEAERFYNYSHAKGVKWLDFDKAFANWLLNAKRYDRTDTQRRNKTKSEEGYEHNMRMLNDAIRDAGWAE